MKTSKKALCGISGILAGLSLYYMALERAQIEIPRYLGIFEDRYQGKSLEQVTENVRTPEEAEDYIIRHLTFGIKKGFGSEAVHKEKKGICYDVAILSRRLLEDNSRYECKLMRFKKDNQVGHFVNIVYDKNKKEYGSLGIQASDCIRTEFDSPQDVFNKINRVYFGRYEGYELDE